MKKFEYKLPKIFIFHIYSLTIFFFKVEHTHTEEPVKKKHDDNLDVHALYNGLPRWFSGKESACWCRGQGDGVQPLC